MYFTLGSACLIALTLNVFCVPLSFATNEHLKAETSIKILSHVVDTKIHLHYSETTVQSRVYNDDSQNELTHIFETIVPHSAFISDFYIEKGVSITRGTLVAKNTSDSEISLWVRNAKLITFQLSLHPLTEVKIVLVYNEVLERKHGHYLQTTYLVPELMGNAQTLKVTTNIDETRKLKFVRLPFNQQDATVNSISPNNTEVIWTPVTNSDSSSTCSVVQYAVQYDLEDGDDGDIIIIDGFLFHFFEPVNMEPLRKHVVFMLDVSGSMASGQKIAQLKNAMVQILSDLKTDDYFNMIIFESAVRSYLTSTHPLEATPTNIYAAQTYVNGLIASGQTSINGAFTQAFNLIKSIRNSQYLPAHVETMVVFLTDGAPTDATTEQIISNVNTQNEVLKVPIYSLAFGVGANKTFLDQLSRQNHAVSKEIFEGADAAEQLKDFYAEISSPVLTDIRISYESDDFDITNLTVTNFTSITQGAGVKVSGRLTPKVPGDGPFKLVVIVEGQGRDGPVTITKEIFLSPTKSKGIYETSFVEKLWAHMAIQQLIDEYLTTGNLASKTESQSLAIRHGFVTPYTTLRVPISRCVPDIFLEPVLILPKVGTNCSTASSPDNNRKLAMPHYIDLMKLHE